MQFHPEVHDEGLDGWYRSAYAELPEAGVTEEQARAADARHLPGQPALADALFGGFARVVGDRRRPALRLRFAHRVTEYPHRLAIPTRWNDNDVYGHVNNVEYYAFFDTVINAYLIRRGRARHPRRRGDRAVRRVALRVQGPLAFPETVTAGLRVGHLGRSSVRYEIGLYGEGARRAGRHRLVRARLRGPRDAAAGGHPAAPAGRAGGAQRASICSLSRSSARPFCLRR